MKVGIVTPCHNRVKYTRNFLTQLLPELSQEINLIIVDDNSKDGTYEVIEEFQKLNKYIFCLRGNGNFFWTKATNLGIRFAIDNGFTHIITLNDDIKFQKGYIQSLINQSLQNPNSICGSLILEMEQKDFVWGAGGKLDFNEYNSFQLENHGMKINELRSVYKNFKSVDYVPGNGTLIPIEIFRKIGLYNSFLFPHYHADSSICIKAKFFGYKVFVSLDSVLFNFTEEHIKIKSSFIERFLTKRSPEYLLPNLASVLYFTNLSVFKKVYYTFHKIHYVISVLLKASFRKMI